MRAYCPYCEAVGQPSTWSGVHPPWPRPDLEHGLLGNACRTFGSIPVAIDDQLRRSAFPYLSRRSRTLPRLAMGTLLKVVTVCREALLPWHFYSRTRRFLARKGFYASRARTRVLAQLPRYNCSSHSNTEVTTCARFRAQQYGRANWFNCDSAF